MRVDSLAPSAAQVLSSLLMGVELGRKYGTVLFHGPGEIINVDYSVDPSSRGGWVLLGRCVANQPTVPKCIDLYVHLQSWCWTLLRQCNIVGNRIGRMNALGISIVAMTGGGTTVDGTLCWRPSPVSFDIN
jgi:hypothetical protein